MENKQTKSARNCSNCTTNKGKATQKETQSRTRSRAQNKTSNTEKKTQNRTRTTNNK